MSGPSLPLQPPLLSVPLPKPALQGRTPHPLNSQARSPPWGLSFLLLLPAFTQYTACKSLTHGSGLQPKGPLTSPPLPTLPYEGFPELPVPPTDTA